MAEDSLQDPSASWSPGETSPFALTNFNLAQDVLCGVAAQRAYFPAAFAGRQETQGFHAVLQLLNAGCQWPGLKQFQQNGMLPLSLAPFDLCILVRRSVCCKHCGQIDFKTRRPCSKCSQVAKVRSVYRCKAAQTAASHGPREGVAIHHADAALQGTMFTAVVCIVPEV